MKKSAKTSPAAHVHKGIVVSGQAAFSARNIAVGDGSLIVDRSVGEPDRERLNHYLESIQQELNRLPKEMTEARNTVESFATALKQEAQKKEPNATYWKITAAGLTEAAKTVAAVAPNILKTALLVAKFFV